MVRVSLISAFLFAACTAAQSVSIVPSRTTGVAPLSVHFDATGTTSTQTTQPFHELHYAWTLGNGNTGPIAVHVFDQPGTYDVGLTVTQPDGTSASGTTQIVVSDPAALETFVFSNDSDFTGAPAGATQITTTSFDVAMANLAAGRRLLFQRGDTFTASNSVTIDIDGPMLVGAFGAGTNPDARGIFDNNPIVDVTHSSNVIRLGSNGDACRDLRIVDLNFTPPSSPGHLVASSWHVENLLVHHVKAGEFSQMASFSPTTTTHALHDLLTIADCDFWETSHIGVYLGGNRVAILGSRWFSNPTGTDEHILRFPLLKKSIIAGNDIRGAAPNKHCIKLHARTYATQAEVSEQIVISDNVVACTTDWAVAMGTGSSSRDERVENVIVERNRFLHEDGSSAAVYVTCQGVTVRNNLFEVNTTTSNSRYCVSVQQRGPGPAPSDVAVYHNTASTDNATLGNYRLCSVGAHDGGLVPVHNNIMWAPNVGTAVVVSGNLALSVDSGNLLGTDPLFTSPTDWSLQSGSPAIDIGVTVPVVDDITGGLRIAPPDAGAYEFGSAPGGGNPGGGGEPTLAEQVAALEARVVVLETDNAALTAELQALKDLMQQTIALWQQAIQ